MNLQTQIEPQLWEAVRTNFEARNYTAAILDAVHFMSDQIRDRAGLEGDGVALAGEAFGGTSPKLKVNKFQSESEKNIQRGVEMILRGVYQAIRNPRSHEKYIDDERDSISIILLIDYLVRIIGNSQNPFSLPILVAKIIDPDFVPNKRYAELIINQIPEKKRLLTCIEVFQKRAEINQKKVKVFFENILKSMHSEDVQSFINVLSSELEVTNDQDTIIFIIDILPSIYWTKLDEVARIRTENKLINSIKEGKFNRKTNRATSGILGTWMILIYKEVILKEELWRTVAEKLKSSLGEEQDYALHFFLHRAADVFETPPFYLRNIITAGLNAGIQRYKEIVEGWGENFPDPTNFDHPWVSPFRKSLEKFRAVEETLSATDDDLPF